MLATGALETSVVTGLVPIAPVAVGEVLMLVNAVEEGSAFCAGGVDVDVKPVVPVWRLTGITCMPVKVLDEDVCISISLSILILLERVTSDGRGVEAGLSLDY